MRITVLLTSLIAFAAATFAAGPGSVPQSEKRPIKDTLHGADFTDPYRWLEGDNSDNKEMGKVNDEVAKWTDAQIGRAHV